MSYEPVHFHKSKLNRNTNILLLLIPAVVFTIILALYYIGFKANGFEDDSVTKKGIKILGEETD